MTPLEGKFDFRTVYMVDYVPKVGFRPPAIIPPVSDDCLIVGLGRDAVKPTDRPDTEPDVLCPLEKEYYKPVLERLEKQYPKVVKNHIKEKEIDSAVIEQERKDIKKTEYIYQYCNKDEPFVSINTSRRARMSNSLRLPDDTQIPDTTYGYHFRSPPQSSIQDPRVFSTKPEHDNDLRDELRRIQRIRTGDTTYGVEISQLGGVILDKAPYGPCREGP